VKVKQIEEQASVATKKAQTAVHLADLLKVVTNSGIAGFGELFYVAVVYALNVLISRFLGAEGVGIYAQAIAVTLLAVLLARLGFDAGILRFVSQYLARHDFEHIRQMASFVSRFVLLTSITVAIGLFLIADVLATSVLHEPSLTFVFRLFALTVPLLSLELIWLSGLQAFQRIDYRVLIERIIQPLVGLGLLAFLLSRGWEWRGVVGATIVATAIGSLLAGFLFLYRFVGNLPRGSKTRPSGLEARAWVSFSYPLLLSGMFAFVVARMAILILGQFRTSAEVGVYDVALKVALAVQLPLAISNTIFAPMIGEIYAKGDLPRLEALFKVVTKWVFIASFFIFSLIILFASPILRIFGPEFILGTVVLFLLALAQLVNVGTGAAGWMLIMSGHSKLHLINATFSAFCTILLCYLLIPGLGMVGAAWAVAITLTGVNLLRLVEVFYLLRIHPYHWDFARSVLAGVISLGVAYYVQQQFTVWGAAPVWRVLGVGGIFVVLYFVLLSLFQANNEERELINWVVHKVMSRHSPGEVS
jgi:O-antigen/teichoic acid export membrane protein